MLINTNIVTSTWMTIHLPLISKIQREALDSLHEFIAFDFIETVKGYSKELFSHDVTKFSGGDLEIYALVFESSCINVVLVYLQYCITNLTLYLKKSSTRCKRIDSKLGILLFHVLVILYILHQTSNRKKSCNLNKRNFLFHL